MRAKPKAYDELERAGEAGDDEAREEENALRVRAGVVAGEHLVADLRERVHVSLAAGAEPLHETDEDDAVEALQVEARLLVAVSGSHAALGLLQHELEEGLEHVFAVGGSALDETDERVGGVLAQLVVGDASLLGALHELLQQRLVAGREEVAGGLGLRDVVADGGDGDGDVLADARLHVESRQQRLQHALRLLGRHGAEMALADLAEHPGGGVAHGDVGALENEGAEHGRGLGDHGRHEGGVGSAHEAAEDHQRGLLQMPVAAADVLRHERPHNRHHVYLSAAPRKRTISHQLAEGAQTRRGGDRRRHRLAVFFLLLRHRHAQRRHQVPAEPRAVARAALARLAALLLHERQRLQRQRRLDGHRRFAGGNRLLRDRIQRGERVAQRLVEGVEDHVETDEGVHGDLGVAVAAAAADRLQHAVAVRRRGHERLAEVQRRVQRLDRLVAHLGRHGRLQTVQETHQDRVRHRRVHLVRIQILADVAHRLHARHLHLQTHRRVLDDAVQAVHQIVPEVNRNLDAGDGRNGRRRRISHRSLVVVQTAHHLVLTTHALLSRHSSPGSVRPETSRSSHAGSASNRLRSGRMSKPQNKYQTGNRRLEQNARSLADRRRLRCVDQLLHQRQHVLRELVMCKDRKLLFCIATLLVIYTT